ncbi:PQQ-like beta-propeller repeat protein [Actinoplanes sp. L3-i22]|uniref:PQQ-like beta-propeller repeat protein n=1 Tax=Actinoplanes sp. L3-i22 TaxID=2836373 RepID=UPI001C84C076|nr:PQQ-like beta-propeller repeat protein [Actinoplanes sp. L3-i22]
MGWERPLDGVEDVPWDELLAGSSEAGATGAILVGVLRDLAAGHGGLGRIEDLLYADADYFYTEYGQDGGYVAALGPAIRFLARIAASNPSRGTSESIVELIGEMVGAPIERHGATEAELDAAVDGVRAALVDSRGALDEVARLFPVVEPTVAQLFAGLGGGAYEPRWRGVARPFARDSAYQIDVVPGFVVVSSWGGAARFLDPGTGETVASFPEYHRQGRSVPFGDPAGPGVLTIANWRGLRRWRHRDGVWKSARIRFRVAAVAVSGDEIYVRTSGGDIGCLDGRTGKQIGLAVRVPGSEKYGLHPYRIGDRRMVALGNGRSLLRLDLGRGVVQEPIEGVHAVLSTFQLRGRTCLAVQTTDDRVRRIDAAAGTPIGVPIPMPRLDGACAYEVGGRPYLAISSGRQILRFDAETGEAAGSPLVGHRREIRGIAAAVIDGRPTLFSVDGSTVRRWDAPTGTPWPAPMGTA